MTHRAMTPILRSINATIDGVSLSDIGDVDAVVTSPPYKTKDGYGDDLMIDLGTVLSGCMKPGARAFINFGQLKEDFARAMSIPMLVTMTNDLKVGQTIIWAKSVVVDGAQRGHYQPIRSDHILNYCWEFIFTFVKPPERKLDRLSIGVGFADKTNLTRGTRGKNGDKHCAGDIWLIPYKTTGAQRKKKHVYEFPEELVERCLKVSDLTPGATVLDPFGGSGTTACVAKKLGYNSVIIDRNQDCLEIARERWDEQR